MGMEKKIADLVDEIIAKRGKSSDQVIPVLQDIQNEYNYLPEEALKLICEQTEISPSQIYGVSTFYSQFRHHPVGKHMIKVCVGTACHVKGAMLVHDAFKRELHINEKEDTDQDGVFTVEKVACLGCCTIAPVVQIDDVTYGHVVTEQIPSIIKDFLSLDKQEKKINTARIVAEGAFEGEIRIGLGSCCVASGSEEVKKALEETIVLDELNINVKHVGCVGVCNQVPMIEIHKPNEEPEYYTKINASEVQKIVHNHFRPKGISNKLRAKLFQFADDKISPNHPKSARRYELTQKDSPITEFLEGQLNIATEHRGIIKPSDIQEYISLGGFKALSKAFQKNSPQEIIEEITRSGLRGRGGGGFLSGKKWELVRNEASDLKYIICNGDEGDPGAFMDRMLLESYPFRVIEGIIIAAYAVGAKEGILYIRAEYPLAVVRVKEAIKKCEETGYLGKNILNSGFDFNLSIFEGAGAFVCGEETALIASIEGKRGLPKLRPPYPSEKGLWNKPTLINNTETFALVSWIINNSGEEFANIGTAESKGTKVFALAGKINRGGLIEVPMGISIREIVEKIGGGIANGKKFKAVQIGGPSGGCIPAEYADISVDFESLVEMGAMMGSGGLIVLDETDCMVDIAKYFLSFTQEQSCGRCTFCRVGTRRMLEILEKISSGKGVMEDIDALENLAHSTKNGSICGLGKTAPNPVLSTLSYFRNEYIEHIHGNCPTGKCLPMVHYMINDDCIGCTKCAQRCPVDAIEAKPYEIHSVDNNLCVKCDVCRQICPVNAVYTQSSKA